MSYAELAASARGNIGPFCRACPVCDGRACAGVMPGPGDKGTGRVAEKNWRSLVVVTTIDMDKYREETVGGDNLPFFEMSDLNLFLEIDGDSREEAKGYPLEERYYFLIDGVAVRATEKNIKKYVKPEMKTAFKNLMHDKFWSWNDAKSLAALLAYI